MVALYFFDSSCLVAHVGDSRLYRIRGGRIDQLTEDHSLVWEQYREGLLSKEGLPSSPLKNIVTRALGMNPTVEVEVQEIDLQKEDLLVFCSDGLSDLVQEEELTSMIRRVSGDLARACRDLAQLANQRGGRDNITTLVIQIE